MGAHKQGDGQKASNRFKGKAPCRGDTRGGSWVGIPKCVIDSAAYRALSLHARAVLVEITARMNGANNGEITVGQRELVEALGCSPNRIVTAIADLMQHGLLDVTVEGQWRARQARQYRLTFVSTKAAPATNDYDRWTPTPAQSRATGAVAGKSQSATAPVAEAAKPATAPIARLIEHKRKTADPQNVTATGAVSPIFKPCTLAPDRSRKGDHGASTEPPKHVGDRSACATAGASRTCEHCGDPFTLTRADRA